MSQFLVALLLLTVVLQDLALLGIVRLLWRLAR